MYGKIITQVKDGEKEMLTLKVERKTDREIAEYFGFKALNALLNYNTPKI